MTTPKLSALKLAFRIETGDNRVKSTGISFVSDSTLDGQKWSSAQLDLMAADAVNWILDTAAGSMPPGASEYEKGAVLERAYPECLKDSAVLTMTPPSLNAVTARMADVALPSDYGWIVSAMYVGGGGTYKRIRQATQVELNAIIEQRNTELAGTICGLVRGTNLYVAAGAQMDVTNDKFIVSYICKQAAMTDGGSVDLVFDAKRNNMVLMRMKQISTAYLKQGE